MLAKLLLMMVYIGSGVSVRAGENDIPSPGKLIEKVTCVADATQSFALYLPSNYDPAKKWPVLFCFDPGARGRRPVECFQAGAEKFGYIVVGSNNSRNGPWPDNAKAIEAMLRETFSRWSVDRSRLYAAGLSGGARVAPQLGLSSLVRGVVACSGAFPQSQTPSKVPCLFFGTAGIDDFNYSELRNVDDDLDKLGAPHRIVTFAGGHEWPPAETAVEAIEWLEIQSMRVGLREKNSAVIEASCARRLAGLSALPIPERWLETKSLLADFKGLVDTTELVDAEAKLAKTRELRDWRKAERAADRQQTALIEQWQESVTESVVASWQKRAAAPEDSPDRRLARRVIQGASVKAMESAREFIRNEQYAEAVARLEIATVLQPDRAGTWFELARARALDGSKKTALAALVQAAKRGYKDAARVEHEKAFAALKNDAGFQDVLRAIAENQAAEKLSAPNPKT
ncbi:MAG: hypothetical protein QM715_14425 [Nibricoccus sp.]